MSEIGTHVMKAQRRGRGAASNASGRYEAEERVLVDDGWGDQDRSPEDGGDRLPENDGPPPLRTRVGIDSSRTIIARNQSPDLNFDRSINPYRGCEHGCIYCFARPTHAWLGLSPGLDFESRLFAKPEAASLLEKELRHPRYACRVMAMGTNTDPYQPVEREMRLTRSILEVLARFRHPLGIVTKSALVTRDIDLLAEMARQDLVKVYLSVTTLDRGLARTMEPRAATPPRRLEAIAALAQAGVPVGVMVAPTIPGLTDHEMEAILKAAREAGADEAGYIALRLPLEIKDLWAEWLAENRPNHARRVMTLLRQMRGGRDYDATFGSRMTGTGPIAQALARRFELAKARLGFREVPRRLDTGRFRPPPQADRSGQLDFFAGLAR
ncbi:PA0069 family radical SAM protein [Marinibaculum pumilum]|uniref:PA0069 family radical SAM protein n=1 Tax=Marinibaculum pumilum TaxID=1766165 RepID=A0ABV7KW93_9PROT